MPYWHKLGVDPTPDLVTTSGSGYDPDITPQDAMVQIPMVSKATGISPPVLRVDRPRDPRCRIGFLGSSYIVVLQLNEGAGQAPLSSPAMSIDATPPQAGGPGTSA